MMFISNPFWWEDIIVACDHVFKSIIFLFRILGRLISSSRYLNCTRDNTRCTCIMTAESSSERYLVLNDSGWLQAFAFTWLAPEHAKLTLKIAHLHSLRPVQRTFGITNNMNAIYSKC